MSERKLRIKPVLVIIRGNSGSGKTTLAERLQTHYGFDSCLVLHQDQLRREILHATDQIGTPAVALIQTLLTFGQQNYPLVILEGILRADVYGKMLRTIFAAWPGTCLRIYLDVDFATCLRIMPSALMKRRSGVGGGNMICWRQMTFVYQALIKAWCRR